MSLNNNQVAEVLNEAIKQATGNTELETLDLQGIIDTANDPSVIGSKEQFTKALVNVMIRRWYTDTSYRSEYVDPFFEDAQEFGAILSCVSVEVPEVQESSAWKEMTSGQTKLGEYIVYLPVVHEQFYGRSVSYELPISISGTQWNTAFHSAEELSGFVAYILMCVDNALVQHLEDMNAMNRNNFMAEKIAYANTESAEGLHKINLVEEYAKSTGKTSLTVTEFMNDANALLFASGKIRLFKDYFKKQSTLFNTAGYRRFTPADRLVIQVLSQFEEAVERVALSDTYHNEVVAMPNHYSIASWQALGALDFDDVSSIDVKIASDGTSVEQKGIVALMVDKWAIMHTIVTKRVATKYFEPEDVTMNWYQATDKYANNLTMNALVFTVEDYTQE